MYTIFLIHIESQIVFYKIVCYNRIFLGPLFCIQARESKWGNFEYFFWTALKGIHAFTATQTDLAFGRLNLMHSQRDK